MLSTQAEEKSMTRLVFLSLKLVKYKVEKILFFKCFVEIGILALFQKQISEFILILIKNVVLKF